MKQGKNISQISKELGIDRKTARKIREHVKDGEVKPPEFSRKSVLEPYQGEIIDHLRNEVIYLVMLSWLLQ